MKHIPLHRIIAICAVIPLVLVAMAQDDVEVTVEVPGTLQEQLLMIEPNARNEVTKLKVNGNIDGNDMMFIRELCGVKNISTPIEGKLTHLDLTDAFIYGRNPRYAMVCRKRIEGVGELEARLEVRNGIIRSADIMGDFFLVGDIEQAILKPLRGCPLEREALTSALPDDLGDIILHLRKEQLIDLILNN